MAAHSRLVHRAATEHNLPEPGDTGCTLTRISLSLEFDPLGDFFIDLIDSAGISMLRHAVDIVLSSMIERSLMRNLPRIFNPAFKTVCATFG